MCNNLGATVHCAFQPALKTFSAYLPRPGFLTKVFFSLVSDALYISTILGCLLFPYNRDYQKNDPSILSCGVFSSDFSPNLH